MKGRCVDGKDSWVDVRGGAYLTDEGGPRLVQEAERGLLPDIILELVCGNNIEPHLTPHNRPVINDNK